MDELDGRIVAMEEQQADAEEDRVGYEEYKRATARKEDKDEE